MKIVVSRPSPRRDPRNSMNYCSILQVLGTRIGGISWISIIFHKIHDFHDFLEKRKNSKFFWIFMKKQVSSPREAPEYIRNDKEYVGFWAGGRGGDENLQFSLISMEFHEIARKSH